MPESLIIKSLTQFLVFFISEYWNSSIFVKINQKTNIKCKIIKFINGVKHIFWLVIRIYSQYSICILLNLHELILP